MTNCDCIQRYDCPCSECDPDPSLDDGVLYCANCFRAIGQCCEECAPTLVPDESESGGIGRETTV